MQAKEHSGETDRGAVDHEVLAVTIISGCLVRLWRPRMLVAAFLQYHTF
jgi:hypothetical protein